MKRRGFLKGLSAAVLATPLLSNSKPSNSKPSHSEPSDKVTKLPSNGVYDAVIVMPTKREAQDIWVAMERPRNVLVVGPGERARGARTELILDCAELPPMSIGSDWYNQVVRPMLIPDGHEVTACFFPEDYGMWLSGTFIDRVEEPYLAFRNRMHVGPSPTYERTITAKATMLKLYADHPPLLDRIYK